MYRHDTVAAHAHIECLQTRVGEITGELAAAERARHLAEVELDRIREGIGDDPDLPDDIQYLRTQTGLRLLGTVGLVGFVAGIAALFADRIADPLWSWRGVQNLWFHIQYGDALTSLAIAGGIGLCAWPWLVIPWLGAVGLRRLRRWGWALAIVGALLYLPTPAMPIAAYALMVLFSGRVRALYFPPA